MILLIPIFSKEQNLKDSLGNDNSRSHSTKHQPFLWPCIAHEEEVW